MARVVAILVLLLGPAAFAGAQDARTEVAALDHFVVVARTGYGDAPAFLRFIEDAERGAPAREAFSGRGPLAILGLALLGGFALNLTPCVLPMIPINLAIIGAGTQARSRARGFLLGGAYGLAMAIVYGVLGAVVILTAGRFGTLNASPWFNAALAALFVVLAFAMLDLVTIDFSRFWHRRPGRERGRGYALALTMGGLSALLAGACVAPVVIEVILFASRLYAGGTVMAIALPLGLGIGMAAPWPLVGGGLASLPRPGRWMVHVKRAFAAFILATAAYYAHQTYTIVTLRDGGHSEAFTGGWATSLEEGLARARRERRLVVIDMWATWCRDCLVMDRTTLADPAVDAALDGFVKIKYLSERPDESPVSDVLDRLGVVGFPTYIALRPID
ncbi:MAG TPA: cytochrome c biogenesis protein CcdA [Vicinamibacterales bacterium]|nr:cytochrome c biogenesis protein CcdA [Vicinamibacterales bacterium]